MSPTPSLAFAGAGWIAAVHGLAAKQLELPITRVASRHREKAKEMAARMGAIACSYEDLPAGADVVVVCSAPQCHAGHALHAIEAGAAVVIEKPLCTTLADADAAGRRPSAPERASAMRRTSPTPRSCSSSSAAIADMGELQHLEVRTVQSRPTWGEFLTEEWGGGALFDLGVHPIAIAMLATGSKVVSVSATLDGADDHPTDEHAEVTLTFDGGFAATVVSSWRGGEVPEWSVQAASKTGVTRAELLPTLLLEHNGDEIPIIPVTGSIPQLEQYGYVGQLEAFHVRVRGPLPSPDGRRIRSRRPRRRVPRRMRPHGKAAQRCLSPSLALADRTPLQLWRG